MIQAIKDWALAIGVALLVWFAISSTRNPDLPEQAPDFTLASIEGGEVQLSKLQGKTVVLNFWATWCGPCHSEIPTFSKFADSNPDIVVLGIATDGDPSELRTAKQEMGISYTVLRTDPETYKAYDISVIPTTVVVGPDGSVEDVHVGVMSAKQLERATR